MIAFLLPKQKNSIEILAPNFSLTSLSYCLFPPPHPPILFAFFTEHFSCSKHTVLPPDGVQGLEKDWRYVSVITFLYFISRKSMVEETKSEMLIIHAEISFGVLGKQKPKLEFLRGKHLIECGE